MKKIFLIISSILLCVSTTVYADNNSYKPQIKPMIIVAGSTVYVIETYSIDNKTKAQSSSKEKVGSTIDATTIFGDNIRDMFG